jgi:integrase
MAQTLGLTTQKVLLTDRFLKGLKAAPQGKRVTIWDAVVPGFGVRVSDRADAGGKAKGISFIVMRRLPGDAQPIRHTIGRYHPDVLPLGTAREKAREALGMIAGGKRPLEERRRQHKQEAEQRANTFSAMAEDFIADMRRRGLRNAGEFEAIIRREYLGQTYKDGQWVDSKNRGWRDRPLAEITAKDAAGLVQGIINRGSKPVPGQRRRKSGGEWAAHHALAIGKTMFEWAIGKILYDIETSPFERIKPAKFIGQKKSRQRILADDELRAVWRAAEQTGAPYGDLVRLLILTGQRLGQVASMQRREVDLDKAVWVTPAEKMKLTKAGEMPHLTPLSPSAVALLRDLFDNLHHRNGYAFTTTGGERPFSGFSKSKIRLDQLVEKIRQEWAAEAGGEVPEPIPPWTLHDLRRTVRSGLPPLGVPDVVAEAVLAHARPGIAGVYDLYSYEREKRDALDKWGAKVIAIVNPPPANVVPITSTRNRGGANG